MTATNSTPVFIPQYHWSQILLSLVAASYPMAVLGRFVTLAFSATPGKASLEWLAVPSISLAPGLEQ